MRLRNRVCSKGAISQMTSGNEGLRARTTAELEEIEAAVKAGVGAIHASPMQEPRSTSPPPPSAPQPPQPQPSSPAPSDTSRARSPSAEQLQLLNKLSALSGISNDKLAHELALDPSFSLPPAMMARVVLGGSQQHDGQHDEATELGDARTPQQQQAEAFHRAMLNTLADRLIASTAKPTLKRGERPSVDQRVFVAQLGAQGVFYSADVQAVHDDDGSVDVVYCADRVSQNQISRAAMHLPP